MNPGLTKCILKALEGDKWRSASAVVISCSVILFRICCRANLFIGGNFSQFFSMV